MLLFLICLMGWLCADLVFCREMKKETFQTSQSKTTAEARHAEPDYLHSDAEKHQHLDRCLSLIFRHAPPKTEPAP